MNIPPDSAIVNPMDIKTPVYNALMKRRMEIAGSINHLENQVGKLKGELVHIDATLGIMGYDVPHLKIRAKTACTSGLFHRNELQRLILGKLRESENGLPLYEIARLIAMDKAWDTQDKRFMVALTDKIGKCLPKWKTRYGIDCRRVKREWVWTLS